MKYYIIIILNLFFVNFVSAQKSIVNSITGGNSELGIVENEAYIKFNYHKHKLDSKVDYNITYFETAIASNSDKNLEFWGHGRKTLSLLGPIQSNLEGEEISKFRKKVSDHYLDFQKNIRLQLKSYEHSDIVLFDDVDFIFSCYMNNKNAEYAFWIDKKKYIISEKSLGLLLLRLESYFTN